MTVEVPQARIFVAEDDEEYRDGFLIPELERDARNKVVLVAENLSEAETAIRGFNFSRINVATLDGNLVRGSGSYLDGMAMLRQIREAELRVCAIGMALESFPEGHTLDKDITKMYVDWNELRHTIDDYLQRPRFQG